MAARYSTTYSGIAAVQRSTVRCSAVQMRCTQGKGAPGGAAWQIDRQRCGESKPPAAALQAQRLLWTHTPAPPGTAPFAPSSGCAIMSDTHSMACTCTCIPASQQKVEPHPACPAVVLEGRHHPPLTHPPIRPPIRPPAYPAHLPQLQRVVHAPHLQGGPGEGLLRAAQVRKVDHLLREAGGSAGGSRSAGAG